MTTQASQATTRILFVDDEPAILAGLQNLLRKERRRWEMVFVETGADALRAIAAAPFDVVVTDMRMPKMDGAELLAQVRARCPRTARIVLSGHAEREAIERALPVAHQYLSKPCSVDELRESIERLVSHKSILDNEQLRVLVGGIGTLPSPPGIYFDLAAAAAKPSTSTKALASIVEADPSVGAKVLQVVNSAYFGLGRRSASIDDAISVLGVEFLSSLVLSAHVFSPVERVAPGFSIDNLQERSARTARLCRRLVQGSRCAGEAFTAGLVADIGELVFAVGMPEPYGELLRAAKADNVSPCHLEREAFGATHAEVGAYLIAMWGLPPAVVSAVAYHHRPSGAPPAVVPVLAPLHFASEFISGGGLDTIDSEFMRVAVSPEDLARFATCLDAVAAEDRSAA